MTVLQVCAFAAPTPGNFIATLSALEAELAQKGVQTIYAFPQRASDKEWCQELSRRAKVYFLPEENARILPETYRAFRKIYAENKVSIVHSHFELYDMPATLMAPKDVKLFWHLHDPIGDGFDKAGMLRQLLTRLQYGLVGRKASLLTVSEKHGAFAASIGFPKEQIVYFPNGINTERIQRVPQRAMQEKKQLLLLGWDVPRKGVDVAVAAAQTLTRKDYQIMIVGQEKCQAYLQEHKVPTISFLRPVSDINTLFKETDVFLHISRAEGQSYALLEAIYAGLPVICSDIPENLFAKQFRNIHWVKTGDVSDLVEKLNALFSADITPTYEDVEHNRQIIEEKYSIKSWVEQMISYYL